MLGESYISFALGLPQGSIYSPWYFSLIMDELTGYVLREGLHVVWCLPLVWFYLSPEYG